MSDFCRAETDVDGDGLADWWEMQYFGNLAQTANGDPDGDSSHKPTGIPTGKKSNQECLTDAMGGDLKIYTPLRAPTP